MNLTTLAAEEADYKTGSLPVALYPNEMRREQDGKQTFYARPIIRERLSMRDIAGDMVVAGVNNEMSQEQIVSIWKKINCAVLDRVANGCSVDTGLGLCASRVNGTFATDSEAFSRERHSIGMSFRTGRDVLKKLNELDVVIRQGNAVKPQISDIRDLEATGPGRLTRGGFLEIKGSNLEILGDDESVGLYFVNEDDPEKTVILGKNKIGINKPAMLACVVPSMLQDGRYRLKVVTQFMGSKSQRKLPQSFIHDQLFVVANTQI